VGICRNGRQEDAPCAIASFGARISDKHAGEHEVLRDRCVVALRDPWRNEILMSRGRSAQVAVSERRFAARAQRAIGEADAASLLALPPRV
jgi:hypothetical protein